MTDPLLMPSVVTPKLQQLVEQLYYLEADLLDSRHFHEWISLFADDLHYWMPVRTTRMPRDESREIEGPMGAAHFDDDKTQMVQRVRKIMTGRAWSEAPASRTRHLVTNVRIRAAEDGEYEVSSTFLVYRTRGETYQDLFAGSRTDILRETAEPAGFRIARRTVLLDQTVVLANNISTFF